MCKSSADIGTVAARLRRLRIDAGISQKRLGELAGIDPDSASARMNQFEKGKHIPHFTVLKQIGNVLEAPVSFFYEENDEVAALLLVLYRHPSAKRKTMLQTLNQLLNEETE